LELSEHWSNASIKGRLPATQDSRAVVEPIGSTTDLHRKCTRTELSQRDSQDIDRLHGVNGQHFTCAVTADHHLVVHLAAPQGSFVPWWTQLRIDVMGWTPVSKELTSPTEKLPLKPVDNAYTATVPQSPTTAAMDLTLE
jgi:hypothetical protein